MKDISPDKEWQKQVALLKEIAIIKLGTGWQKQLAEKTNFYPNNISRMLSLQYPPKLDSLMILAKALNLEVKFEDLDSAKTALEKAMENQKK
ncbi:helix-turn-helix domain-containing protein [Tenacibaculum finnmarkense]|uniref:helix-turn-helix domain-containing protein n=1 Tax=Tenacibaculum finnmarkense TaxID=2781243 RepID=UPI00187B136E|nr:helix-turn-helix transcriptional regulator [Tenacibaculum finnmarkense]MBE7649153.1 hypothetical protein [Tenacibaculum finnmarkense genomovar ulcerans]